MMLQFTKATKEQSKLRLAIFGPSGSGKTFTALRLATGLSGKVALIDTERGSASKYADRFEFDVLELPKKDIDTYLSGINAAGQAGYNVLIIDSLSHAWKELLDEVEKLAKAKYRGNTWSAWSEGTPKQNTMVDAILSFPGHVIATMRSKTEWTTQDAGNGKTKPVRVGLAPEQGKGIEYEFDLLMELSTDHICTIIKDRTGKFQDKMIDKPGEDFGIELAEWLKDGTAPPEQKSGKAIPSFAKLEDLLFQLNQDFGLSEKDAKAKLKELGFTGWPTNGNVKQKSTEMYLAVEKAMKAQADAEAEAEQDNNMILDDFEVWEVDKLIEAMQLLVKTDPRDGDSKHILQLLKDIKENDEVLTVVKRKADAEADKQVATVTGKDRMMKEILTAVVVIPDGDEAILSIHYYQKLSVVEFYLDDELIFSADWGNNIMRLFIRALQLWFDWDQIEDKFYTQADAEAEQESKCI